MEKPKRIDKKGGLIGILAGLLASLCCITPVVLIFLGLGSVSFAFSFIGLKAYFLIASLILLGIAFYIHLQQKKCGIWTGLKSPFTLTALGFYLILFIGSLYLVLPWVGSYVFEKKLSLTNNVPPHPPSCHLQLKVALKSFDALTCTSCEAALKYQLEQNQGVYVAEVDLSSSQALVHYDKEKTSSKEIIGTVPNNFEIKNSVDQCS